MKIKIDENMPSSLVQALADLGHEVDRVLDEGLTGSPDQEVWKKCLEEGRFLITQDLDFADARKIAGKTHPGVMVLRSAETDGPLIHRLVLDSFKRAEAGLAGKLVIVTETKVRIRAS